MLIVYVPTRFVNPSICPKNLGITFLNTNDTDA